MNTEDDNSAQQRASGYTLRVLEGSHREIASSIDRLKEKIRKDTDDLEYKRLLLKNVEESIEKLKP